MKLLVVIGSLRRQGFSRKLADAVIERLPEGAEARLIDGRELPLYDQDLDGDEKPAPVATLLEQVSGGRRPGLRDPGVQLRDPRAAQEPHRLGLTPRLSIAPEGAPLADPGALHRPERRRPGSTTSWPRCSSAPSPRSSSRPPSWSAPPTRSSTPGARSRTSSRTSGSLAHSSSSRAGSGARPARAAEARGRPQAPSNSKPSCSCAAEEVAAGGVSYPTRTTRS